jgi:hypothetical protein
MDVIGKTVDRYSQFSPSSLSVQNYLDFGRTGDQPQSYVFLRKEILVSVCVRARTHTTTGSTGKYYERDQFTAEGTARDAIVSTCAGLVSAVVS